MLLSKCHRILLDPWAVHIYFPLKDYMLPYISLSVTQKRKHINKQTKKKKETKRKDIYLKDRLHGNIWIWVLECILKPRSCQIAIKTWVLTYKSVDAVVQKVAVFLMMHTKNNRCLLWPWKTDYIFHHITLLQRWNSPCKTNTKLN